jgi:hypothetical protein
MLAILSWPIVAMSLDAGPETLAPDVQPSMPLDALARWVAAGGAVLSSALIAGTIGGYLVRWRTIVGTVVTGLIAWIIAIIALPIAPALLGLPVGFAYGCFDTCSPVIRSSDPASGLSVAQLFFLGPLKEEVPFVALVAGVGVWAYFVSRWDYGQLERDQDVET